MPASARKLCSFVKGGKLSFTNNVRHCLHGRSFICNRIGFDAVTPFVYTALVRVRYQNRVVLKTLSKVERFQNDTVPLVV